VKTIQLTIALMAASFAAAAPSAAAAANRSVACPAAVSATHGQAYRIVQLEASNVSCTTARRVATAIATDLVHGKPVSLPGSSSIAVSSTTPCPDCASRAEVTVAVHGGSVTFAVTGKLKQAAPSLTLPRFPLPVPVLPTPQSPPPNALTV
jgi:hypothetical protein